MGKFTKGNNMKALVLYIIISQLLEIIVKVKGLVTVVTVATDVNNPGHQDFMLSAKAYGIPVQNLNENCHWNYTSLKINLFRKFLNNFESTNPSKHIILFVDSYDLIFLSGLHEIISKFKTFPATKVLFSAELNCYPDSGLIERYPREDRVEVYPFLNSGGIIGYLPYLKRILNYKNYVEDNEDQLFYTNIYLEESLRKEFQMTLDHNATIFMSLSHASNHIEVVNATRGYRLKNKETQQLPPIIHGNGPIGKGTLKQLYEEYFRPQFEDIVHII